MKNTILFGILFAGLLLTNACNIINPPEEIPSYIHVENFQLTTSVGEGSNSNAIVDAYVFIDGSFLGVYTLPATLPVLASGETRVEIAPGIKDNGIDATPEIYPFFDIYQVDVDLQATEVDTIRPVTQYSDDLKFSILENFENTLQVFRDDIDEDDGTSVELSSEVVFEGSRSGKIELTKDHPIIQVASIRLSELPIGSQGVYLELNYRSEVVFEAGVYYYNNLNERTSDFRHGVNAKATWNKIYINMTPEFTDIVNIPDLTEFQIGFRSVMARDEDGEYLDGSREIYLDNVKLVHF